MNASTASDARKWAEESFSSGLNCAESVSLALARAQTVDMELLPRMATAFGGGMARSCGQCGALTGGIMGISLALGRSGPEGSVEAVYAATRELIRDFQTSFGSRNCQELLGGCDLGTPEGQAAFKERNLRAKCMEFTGSAAEMAERIIMQSE